MKHTSTQHLLLEKPVPADLIRFFEINNDPQTNLYNPSGPMNFQTAEKTFFEILQHWETKGFGIWSILEKENPGFVIGFGGLSERLYGNEIKLNLGYRFDKTCWGKGYATELAKYAITYGFRELDKKIIFALVRPGHTASIRVLEKSNMVLSGELDDVPGKQKSLVYQVENTQ